MSEATQGGDADRFKDEYIGKIERAADPSDMLRCKVRVYGVNPDSMSTDDLPPAEFRFSVGMRPNAGIFMPVQVGDYVWVDFPYKGDTRRPRITGGVHYSPNGSPDIPNTTVDGLSAGVTVNGLAIHVAPDASLVVSQTSSGTVITINADGSIMVTTTSTITLDAPITIVTGDISGTGVSASAGKSTATFTGDVGDKNGTMQEIRDIYNAHLLSQHNSGSNMQ